MQERLDSLMESVEATEELLPDLAEQVALPSTAESVAGWRRLDETTGWRPTPIGVYSTTVRGL